MNSKVLEYSKEGRIKITIEGRVYVYFLDGIFIPTFLSMHRRNKGRAIAYLKTKQRFYKEIKNEDKV